MYVVQALQQRRIRRTASILESEETERKRRWGHFLSTRAHTLNDTLDPAAQQAAALQQLSVWLQEHREEPNVLTEERCAQVMRCAR